MPQPYHHQIQAMAATYITAHGNTRSLTHWARPGIRPTTSSFLVGFISPMPQWELLSFFFFFLKTKPNWTISHTTITITLHEYQENQDKFYLRTVTVKLWGIRYSYNSAFLLRKTNIFHKINITPNQANTDTDKIIKPLNTPNRK